MDNKDPPKHYDTRSRAFEDRRKTRRTFINEENTKKDSSFTDCTYPGC